MLMRYAQKFGDGQTTDPGEAEPEQPSTGKWYEKELAEAVAAGITDGTRPDDYCTRAEAAVMVLRALGKR